MQVPVLYVMDLLEGRQHVIPLIQRKYPTNKKQHVIHSVIHMPAGMGGKYLS